MKARTVIMTMARTTGKHSDVSLTGRHFKQSQRVLLFARYNCHFEVRMYQPQSAVGYFGSD